MKCPKCHIENPDDNKFCRECGEALLSVCANCGNNLQVDDKFCGKCGQQVIEEAIEETPQFASEGERKHVTVLFSDLSGYTAMSEKLDPEEIKEITGRIFGEISKIIATYDGFVEKYAGDAVMALFGANQSHEDDPVRAVKAAKEIHDLVQTLSPQYYEKIGRPLTMHSGINTGLVVTGELNLEKGVHGVAGDAINVSARLSGAAKAGEILVDHETYTRTEGYFQFEDLPPIQLKGKTKAVQIHKLLSAKEQPRKIHRLHGLRAELIGRSAEMARLAESIDNLRQGKGAVYSIIGNAGTGKSRLVEEFKASLDLKEIQWREGNAFAYAQNIPYFPFIDLISKAIQIDDGDSPETIKEKLESSVADLIEESQDVAPYIGNLYALNYPQIREVSPEFWKTKLQNAILKILTALARRAPTVVCLEDLHWADPSTIELVNYLLSEIRQPILFICVYRPTVSLFSTHQINSMAVPHQELQLRDLSLSEAQNMVESLLKTEAIPKDLQLFIQNKVEGNPFYLEEAINSLIESNILVPDNGHWQVVRPITDTEISATIQGVITARVDRLEQESKRILQEASVIGRSFFYDILKRISELKDNIDRNLSGLERFDLIKTKSIHPYLEYIFKHALTQEVVYNGLLKKERRNIHERIAKVVEELFEDRLLEFYETLAFHFKRGRSVRKAVDYLMKSGDKSLKRYAVEESHKYYREAYDLLKNESGKTRHDNELLLDLLVKWALVYYYRGDFRGLNNLYDENLKLSDSFADTPLKGMFYAWLGATLTCRARFKPSYEYLKKAEFLGDKNQDDNLIGFVYSWLAWCCTGLGLLDDAIRCGERAQEIARRVPSDPYIYFKSLGGLGFTYYIRGDKKKVLDIGQKLVEFGLQHSNIRSQTMGLWTSGLGYALEGNFGKGIKYLKLAVETAADPFYTEYPRKFLGLCYVSANQWEQAEESLKKTMAFGKEFGSGGEEIWAQILLGVVYVANGKMHEGLNLIEQVRQSLLNDNLVFFSNLAELALGKVYLQMVEKSLSMSLSKVSKNLGFLIKTLPFAGRKAEAHLLRAVENAKKYGSKSFMGQAYLDLGCLYKAQKKFDKATEFFSEAIQIFEKCEMDGYLKQAREALTSLNH